VSPVGFAPLYVAADERCWGLARFCTGRQQSCVWSSGGKRALESYSETLLPFGGSTGHAAVEKAVCQALLHPVWQHVLAIWAAFEIARGVLSCFGYLYPSWLAQNILAKSNTLENQLNEKIPNPHTHPKYNVCLFKASLAFLCSWASRLGQESSCDSRHLDGICGCSLAFQFRLLDEYGLDWVSGFQFTITRYQTALPL